MPKLPVLSPEKLARALEKEDFYGIESGEAIMLIVILISISLLQSHSIRKR
jgi:hypothetical protein